MKSMSCSKSEMCVEGTKASLEVSSHRSLAHFLLLEQTEQYK